MTSFRTPEQIVARANRLRDDFGGFAVEVLVPYLPYGYAKPFLRNDVTAEDWTQQPLDDAAGAAWSYYEFALGKIENHRSLSADVAVTKLREFAWLLGRDDAITAMDEAGYENYGAPKVKAFATAIRFPWPDDEAMNRMAAGEPCTPDCEDGCGR